MANETLKAVWDKICKVFERIKEIIVNLANKISTFVKAKMKNLREAIKIIRVIRKRKKGPGVKPINPRDIRDNRPIPTKDIDPNPGPKGKAEEPKSDGDKIEYKIYKSNGKIISDDDLIKYDNTYKSASKSQLNVTKFDSLHEFESYFNDKLRGGELFRTSDFNRDMIDTFTLFVREMKTAPDWNNLGFSDGGAWVKDFQFEKGTVDTTDDAAVDKLIDRIDKYSGTLEKCGNSNIDTMTKIVNIAKKTVATVRSAAAKYSSSDDNNISQFLRAFAGLYTQHMNNICKIKKAYSSCFGICTGTNEAVLKKLAH